MHVSAKQLSRKHTQQIHSDLTTVMAHLHGEKEVAQFLENFLTETEYTILAKRLAIAVLLSAGKSYQEIKTTLNVSTATISSVAEHKETPGFKLALQKITDNNWAEQILARFNF
jgi:uncharacterized protein YerC